LNIKEKLKQRVPKSDKYLGRTGRKHTKTSFPFHLLEIQDKVSKS
jgi:hypothetical protein